MRFLLSTTRRLATRFVLTLTLAAVTQHVVSVQPAAKATEIDFGLSVGLEVLNANTYVVNSSIPVWELPQIEEALGIGIGSIVPQSSSTWRGFRKPVVSGFLQIRLTDKLSINPEVIFQRAYETGQTNDDVSSFGPRSVLIPTKNPLAFGRTHTTINVWEFPILFKYRFTKSSRSPFVAAGPTFWTENSGTLRSRSTDPHYGVSVAFGYNLPWGRWNLIPQLRYTRWAGSGFSPVSFDYSSGLGKNQLRAMIGFTF